MHVILYPLLLFIIVFSPLAYGSVTTLALTISETAVAAIILLWLLEMAHKRQFSFLESSFLMPLYLFLGLVIFQLVPLPQGLMKLISGPTFNLYQKLIPGSFSKNLMHLNIYPHNGIEELLKLSSYIGLFLFVINKIEKKWQFDIVINSIIFLGFTISLFALIQKYSFPDRIYWFDPPKSAGSSFGPFFNRNSFAGYIDMVMPLTLGYSLTEMGLSRRFIYWSSFGVMNLALFLSLSRAGILVYSMAIFFLLLCLWLKNRYSAAEMKTGYIWLFIIACLLVFLLEARSVLARFNGFFSDDFFIIFGHGYSWIDILKMWRNFPFLGTGLGTFGNISGMYKASLSQASFTYAHNDYLQLLSETGLVGFILVALFFISYFNCVIKFWLKTNSPYIFYVTLGGISSIIGMLVYSMLDFNLHIPANAILFFIIMGLIYKLVSNPSGHSFRERKSLDLPLTAMDR